MGCRLICLEKFCLNLDVLQQNNILLEQNALIYESSLKNSEILRIYSAME